MQGLNDMIAAHAKAHKTDRIHLAYSQIRSKSAKYPVLKSTAAETRRLARVALVVAHAHAGHLPGRRPMTLGGPRLRPHSAEYQRLAVLCLEGLVGYLDSLEVRGRSHRASFAE